MNKYIAGIRRDSIRLLYFVEANSREEALTKIETQVGVHRDPYGRNWVQEVQESVEYITSYPIPDPYVG